MIGYPLIASIDLLLTSFHITIYIAYNKKVSTSNIEYKMMDKHIAYSDQFLGAVSLFLRKSEEKFIKVGTFIGPIINTKIYENFVKIIFF